MDIDRKTQVTAVRRWRRSRAAIRDRWTLDLYATPGVEAGMSGGGTGLETSRRLDALVGRLRRTTASTRYIPEVDGLRFLAIAMVVAFHLLATYRLGVGEAHMVPRPFGNAEMGSIDTGFASRLVVGFGYGVEIFFGISGFILALPFIAERFADGPRRSVRAYYLRRVTRLEPPYIVALGLASVLALLVGTDPGVVRSRFLTQLRIRQRLRVRPCESDLIGLMVTRDRGVLLPLSSLACETVRDLLRRLDAPRCHRLGGSREPAPFAYGRRGSATRCR